MEFTHPKSKNRKPKRNSWLIERVMTWIISLQSVSEFLTDVEDYFFHVNLRAFLLSWGFFPPVLIVWDESFRKHGHRTDKNESSITGLLSLKRIDSGQ